MNESPAGIVISTLSPGVIGDTCNPCVWRFVASSSPFTIVISTWSPGAHLQQWRLRTSRCRSVPSARRRRSRSAPSPTSSVATSCDRRRPRSPRAPPTVRPWPRRQGTRAATKGSRHRRPPSSPQAISDTASNAPAASVRNACAMRHARAGVITVRRVGSYDEGVRIRTEVLGREHVERSSANATDLDRPFLEWITEHVWGDLWADPTLDRKTRSMVTIAILAALGRDELALHLRASTATGVSDQRARAGAATRERLRGCARRQPRAAARQGGACTMTIVYTPRAHADHPPFLYSDYKGTRTRSPAHAAHPAGADAVGGHRSRATVVRSLRRRRRPHDERGHRRRGDRAALDHHRAACSTRTARRCPTR